MDCESTEFAPARSSSPLRRAISAVVPTHSACAMIRRIMRGCAVRLTAAMAYLSTTRTIAVSAALIMLSSAPSIVAGHAIASAFL